MTMNVTIFRMFHNRRFTTISIRFVVQCGLFGGILCWGSAFSTSRSTAKGVELQPYSVFVAESDSYLRSGPSPDYYRTDPLTHGQQLEVYAKTDEGWLGVRPPSNSFSWIPMDAVELDGSGETGTVLENQTVAWVGTHLGRARNWGWQVQLSKEETVTIIGRSEREGPDGPATWLRIVPPSGEFRFIHHSQTVRTSEALVESVASAKRAEPVMFSNGGPIAARTTHTPPQRDRLANRNPSNRRTNPSPSASPSDRVGSGLVRSGQSVLVQPSEKLPSSVDPEHWQPNAQRASVNEPLPPSLISPTLAKASANDGQSKEYPPRGLLAAVAFKGNPRLNKIGETSPAPPATGGQWVANGFRKMMGTPQASIGSGDQSSNVQNPETQPFVQSHITDPNILPVSGAMPMVAQDLVSRSTSVSRGGLTPSSLPPNLQSPNNIQPTKQVSVEQITRVHQEVQNATAEQLEVTLSRLMAERASAEESEVVAAAARGIARTTPNTSLATHAREIAEQADRYARLASRRDRSISPTFLLGQLSTTGTPVIPMPSPPSVTPLQPAPNQGMTMTGQLVQVYSARPHSPPYALTDATGRTIAYVTPSPGINLSSYLNTQVTVSGTAGQPTGLDTPHVIAQRADPEGRGTF